MRLIDADKLIEGMVSNDPVVIAAKCEPTSYDADKVIEELKKEAFYMYCDNDDDYYCEDEPFVVISLRKAIDIVKRGGVMTEYERQKVVDFINGLEDEEKEIAKEILMNWQPAEPEWKQRTMAHFTHGE